MLEEGTNGHPGEGGRGGSRPQLQTESGGHLIVRCEDTLIGTVPRDPRRHGRAVQRPRAPAPTPPRSVGSLLARNRSPDGFFMERHPKLDPVGYHDRRRVHRRMLPRDPRTSPTPWPRPRPRRRSILSLIARKARWSSTQSGRSVNEELLRRVQDLPRPLPLHRDHLRRGTEQLAERQRCSCARAAATCVAACPASAISGSRLHRSRRSSPSWPECLAPDVGMR